MIVVYLLLMHYCLSSGILSTLCFYSEHVIFVYIIFNTCMLGVHKIGGILYYDKTKCSEDIEMLVKMSLGHAMSV